MSEWIDCQQEMPPEHTRVLCSSTRDGTVIARLIPQFKGIRHVRDPHWQGDASHSTFRTWKFNEVTHWMPLHKPVKMPPATAKYQPTIQEQT